MGAKPIRAITAEDLAAIGARQFGQPVVRITAPGGRGRASLRLHFADRSVIASLRSNPARRAMEAMVLDRLSAAGAPVPAFLGERDGVLFQQDAGSRRLSAELSRNEGAAQDAIARRAIDSLGALKAAVRKAGLAEELPAIALHPDWLANFTRGPLILARQLGLELPAYDRRAITVAITAAPGEFVKWDARPGNAAVQPDGAILWYDWEHAGMRHGPEDMAFLFGDEFWPLDAARSLALLPGGEAEAAGFLACFVTLQVVQRLLLIRSRARRHGWADPAEAMRYDRIGTAPGFVTRLAAHGADWAAREPLVAPLGGWFARICEVAPDRPLRHWPGRATADRPASRGG